MKNILFVDRDEEIRDLIKAYVENNEEIIQTEKLNILISASLAEAEKIFDNETVDGIIVDAVRPAIPGRVSAPVAIDKRLSRRLGSATMLLYRNRQSGTVFSFTGNANPTGRWTVWGRQCRDPGSLRFNEEDHGAGHHSIMRHRVGGHLRARPIRGGRSDQGVSGRGLGDSKRC